MNDKHLEIIKEYAKYIHTGQLYGGKDYFEAHLEPVAKLAREYAEGFNIIVDEVIFDPDVIEAIGYLHDSVEDRITIEELDKFIINDKRLEGLSYDDQFTILAAVEMITNEEDEYYNYIVDRVLSNPLSAIVKKADLYMNLKNATPKFKKWNIYLFAHKVITENLKNILD